jgi:hypothetical protein
MRFSIRRNYGFRTEISILNPTYFETLKILLSWEYYVVTLKFMLLQKRTEKSATMVPYSLKVPPRNSQEKMKIELWF